jgi:uncharacterized protein YutE (UPF0331/DUF86 family)
MLNRDLLQRKIKLILEDLDRLREYKGLSFEEISNDFVKEAVIERLLEKIITRAIDVNRHMISELGKGTEKIRGYEDTFHALAELGIYDKEFAARIARSAGLRNRIVHEYNDTDPAIIFASVGEALKQYTHYCEVILKFEEKKK